MRDYPLLTKQQSKEAQDAWDKYGDPDHLFPTGEFLYAWQVQQSRVDEAARLMIQETGRRMEVEKQMKTLKEINKINKQLEKMGLPDLSWSRAKRTTYNAKRNTLCEHRERLESQKASGHE